MPNGLYICFYYDNKRILSRVCDIMNKIPERCEGINKIRDMSAVKNMIRDLRAVIDMILNRCEVIVINIFVEGYL